MWPFGSNGGGKASNREMRIELANQTGLSYPDSEGLVTVSKSGKMAGRKVKYFRVFQGTGDPAEDNRGYDEIPEDSILYDGIIEKDGEITLNKGRKMR